MLPLALLVSFLLLASPAAADELWVSAGQAGCSDDRSRAQADSRDTPWCSLDRAGSGAQAGDTVHLLPGRHAGTLRPQAGNTRWVGAGDGVTIDAAGATSAVKVVAVDAVEIADVAITNGAAQGVWLERASDTRLADVSVHDNDGAGVQLKAAAAPRITGSRIADNGSAGIQELAGTRSAVYADNTVSDNGKATAPYNGDGIQLAGTGATVAGNVIRDNGNSTYEHGIYTGANSSGWTIERNRLAANAGANVKLAGGPGVARRNRMVDGRFGVVLSDNPAVVRVEHNLLEGSPQHLVLVTQGATPARASLLANTIVQRGRATGSGDASAVFVNAAAALELRNNILCYTGADALGVALWINDPARVGGLRSDTNWLCATDARDRPLAWAGTRVSLARWREASRQDAASHASRPPSFDAELRVSSSNWGLGRGTNLGLREDFAGAALPPTGPVDVGAYRARR